MPWYTGPHLLEHLERIPRATPRRRDRSACPCRPCCATGSISAASPAPSARAASASATASPMRLSGQSAHVLRIATMGRDLEIATQGQAVALQLDTDIDVARGAVLSTPDSQPTVADAASRRASSGCGRRRSIRAPATCCARRPTSRRSRRIEIKSLLDLETLAAQPAEACLRQRHRHRRHHARPPGRRRPFADIPGDGHAS